MTTPLLTTKLGPPQLRARRVPRQRLTRLLDAGLLPGHKLTLVSAPAGYGKTTPVADWLSGTSERSAWLSLDADDGDPARFRCLDLNRDGFYEEADAAEFARRICEVLGYRPDSPEYAFIRARIGASRRLETFRDFYKIKGGRLSLDDYLELGDAIIHIYEECSYAPDPGSRKPGEEVRQLRGRERHQLYG